MKSHWRPKALSALLVAAFISMSLPTSAYSAGSSSCTKSGITKNVGSTTYLCSKSGSKLVWQVKSPASSAFYATIPISLPVSSHSITFDNILGNLASIPLAAYNNENSVLTGNSLPTVSHDIFLAPTLENHYSRANISTALDRAIRFYSGFHQPNYFATYIFDNAHLDWALKKFQAVASAKKYASAPNYVDNSKQALGGICGSGDCYSNVGALIAGTNDGYMGISVDNGFHDIIYEGGIAHSYGHEVQHAQYDNKSSNQNTNQVDLMPFWFFQGGINQPSWFLSGSNYNYYQDARNTQAFNLRGVALRNFSSEAMTNYLLTGTATKTIDLDGKIVSGSGGPGSVISNLGNSLGGLACEALIAIGGGQSVMAVIATIANGNSWPLAFQKVYGVSWEKAAPILGKVMAAELAAHPPK